MARRYRITVSGRSFEVEVGQLDSSPVRVLVDGHEYQVDLPLATGRTPVRPASETGQAARERPATVPARPRSSPQAGAGAIAALMPGRVVSVEVSVGDSVTKGQTVCVIESMKMEQSVSTPTDGRVSSIHVAAGDAVQHGQVLIELQ